MKIFAIDTSTSRIASCYVDDEKKVFIDLETHEKHGLQINQIVEKMKEVNFGDIDVVGIGIGPGSLTGLRVGISFATGLGIGKKIVQVNSLKLIASNLKFYDGYIVVVRKAREGYLYGAIYKGQEDGNLIEIEAPFIDSIDFIREKAKKYNDKVFIGDGAQFFDERFEDDDINFPSSRNLFKLVSEEIELGNFVEYVEPMYLQKSIAELNFEKRLREKQNLENMQNKNK